MIRIEVNGNVTWRVAKSSEGNWVAVCDPLNLTMEGASLDELHANIAEALNLLMSELLETGELETFLKNRGWRAVPVGDQQGPMEFNVPYELLVRPLDQARALLQ